MHPELFEIPFLGWRLHAFGVMVVLGFLAGGIFVRHATRRDGIPREKTQDLPIWMVLSGLLGARLFYVIQFWDESFSGGRALDALKIWEGGLVFYGGLLLGAAAFVVYCRLYSLPLRTMLDAMAPATAFGLAFGRIGCFLNGCCFGRACEPGFPLGVRFPADSLPSQVHPPGTAIHPTQLYESFAAFAMALLLWGIWRRRPAPGRVLASLFILYGISRFVLEGIRGDHGVPLGAWTVSRWISVGAVAFGIAFWTLVGVRAETSRPGSTSRAAAGPT